MKTPLKVYGLMGLVAAVALGAMAYVTFRALALERRQRQDQRFAAEQEKVRLALWRLDAAAMALLVAEGGRSSEDYEPLQWRRAPDTIERAAAAWYERPSPLLKARSGMVRLHFTYQPASGALGSPQVPGDAALDGRMLEIAQVSRARLAQDRTLLEHLRAKMDGRLLSSRVKEISPSTALAPPLQQALDVQYGYNTVELNNRFAQNANLSAAQLSLRPATEVQTPAVALWHGEELMIVRGVGEGRELRILGSWLDRAAVQTMLLAAVSDLLPEASLEPIGPGDGQDVYRMASLPLRLSPGNIPVVLESRSALATPLAAAWACLLAALLAGAGVLRAQVSLGERRRAFVSAVTHELRTPLTTFRLYSEMLASGMIADETKRHQYTQRLAHESRRLGHLVENVLAYCRLSGPRRGPGRQKATLVELVEHARRDLEELAGRADMQLVVEPATPQAQRASVAADVAAVEQILVNLVDNACKYAAQAADKRVRVGIGVRGRWGQITVTDAGPGIPAAQRGGLFRDFGRSAAQAAGGPPGIGLGLAISRRLARQMGGDLRLSPSESGTTFVLLLPAQQQPAIDAAPACQPLPDSACD